MKVKSYNTCCSQVSRAVTHPVTTLLDLNVILLNNVQDNVKNNVQDESHREQATSTYTARQCTESPTPPPQKKLAIQQTLIVNQLLLLNAAKVPLCCCLSTPKFGALDVCAPTNATLADKYRYLGA